MKAINQVIPTSHQFCYIFVRSSADTILSCIYLLGILLLSYYTYKWYHKSTELGLIGKQVNLIYYLIIFWAIIFLTQYSINISYYYDTLAKYKQQEQIPNLKQFSIANNFLTALVGFTVQGLLIQITINIITNVFNYNSIHGEIFAQNLMKFYKFIKIYRWVRYLRAIQLIMFVSWQQQLNLMSKIGLYITQADSIIIFIIMILAYLIILRKYLFTKNYLVRRQKQKLHREYITLVICSIYRIFSLFAFVHIFRNDSQCPKSSIQKTLQIYGLRQPQQIIPIYFLIKIQFWIQKQQQIMSQSSNTNSQILYR